MARGRRKKCRVPWPDLPLHLLELVSSRLRLIDYLNFRRVCSTWRAAAKQHNPCLDYPLLMTPGRRVGRRVDDECRFFIKASDGFFIKASDGKRCVMVLPEFGKRYSYVGCFYGWLLIGDLYLRHLLFLMNPFTGARIDLPLWDVTKSVYRATLSSPPTEPNCVVIILNYWYSNITFCRIGDNEWTTQKCHLEKPEEALLFRGKFYILCHQLRLPDAECSSQPKLAMMKLPQGPHHSYTFWKCVPYLVESGDEILLVVKGYSRQNGAVDRFIVLQLDLSTLSWLVLESLRDHILFLGENCSVSLQAARLGCRGNLIYFTEPDHSGCWVFDMENGSINSISRRKGSHKYTNENHPHPVWITPHFV